MAILTYGLVIYQHYSTFDATADEPWANSSPTPAVELNETWWDQLTYNKSGVRFTDLSIYRTSKEISFVQSNSITLEFGFQFSTLPSTASIDAPLYDDGTAKISVTRGNKLVATLYGKSVEAPFTPVRNVYYHVAVVGEGNTVSIYLNGVLLNSNVTIGRASTMSNEYNLGIGASGGAFVGYYKYFRMYARPLRDYELQENYANGDALGLGNDPLPPKEPIAYTKTLTDSVRLTENFQKMMVLVQKKTLTDSVGFIDSLTAKKGVSTSKTLTDSVNSRDSLSVKVPEYVRLFDGIKVTEPFISTYIDRGSDVQNVEVHPNSILGSGADLLIHEGILFTVTAQIKSSNTAFKVSRDLGATWKQQQSTGGNGDIRDIAVTAGSTYLGDPYAYSAILGDKFVYAYVYDLSGTNAGYISGSYDLHETQNVGAGIAMAYEKTTKELHVTWCAATGVSQNSHKLFYRKGIVGANNTITWGALITLSTYENSNFSQGLHGFRFPSITIKNGKPVIIVGFRDVYYGQYSLAMVSPSITTYEYETDILSRTTGWGNKRLIPVQSYENATKPNIIDVPNASMAALVFHGGLNPSNPSLNYIFFSRAYDVNGVTWVTPISVVPGTNPSITADRNGKLIIFFEHDGFIKKVESTNNGASWSSPIQVVEGSKPSALYDQTTRDYAIPYVAYEQGNAVKITGSMAGTKLRSSSAVFLEQFLVEDKVTKRAAMSRTFRETLATGETFTKKGTNNKYGSVTDSVTVTDSLTKRYTANRVLTDQVNSVEALRKAAAIGLAERLLVTDGTIALLKGNIVKLYETLLITDTTKKSISKIQRDSMTITENESGKTSKALSSEILSISDAQLQSMLGTGVKRADIITMNDTLKKALMKVLRDSIGTTDSIKNKATIRNITDTIAVIDTVTKALKTTKTLRDTVTLIDRAVTMRKYKALQLYDSVFVTDLFSYYLPKEYREMVEYTIRVHSEILAHLSTVKTSETETSTIVTGRNFTTKA